MRIPFASQAYKSDALPLSAQECVNYYAEKQPADAKSELALFACPGLVQWLAVGDGPIRGMRVLKDVLYVVSGTQLWSVTTSLQKTLLGSGIAGLGVVRMEINDVQVGIVTGMAGFIYDLNHGFSQITAVGFQPANTLTFFDEYFIADQIGSNRFGFSALIDGTSWDPLDYYAAEVHPDFVVGLINQQQNLLVFTQKGIETWYDTGDNTNPFARYNGATVERGCAAPLTILKEDNSVFFLGDDLIAYRLDGVLPRRVSQHAIEKEVGTYSIVSDAFAFSWTYGGHKFITVTFPTANRTYVYDIATSLWHRRESHQANGASLGRWRGNCAVEFNNKTLIGDGLSNQIGIPSGTTYTEYGSQMHGILAAPPLHSDRKRCFMSSLELDMEVGVGLTTGQGSDPQVMLDWSDDGGRTFKPFQLWRALGKLGEYLTRVRWTRLGNFRQRIYRLRISDPVPRVIIAAHGEIEVGDG